MRECVLLYRRRMNTIETKWWSAASKPFTTRQFRDSGFALVPQSVGHKQYLYLQRGRLSLSIHFCYSLNNSATFCPFFVFLVTFLSCGKNQSTHSLDIYTKSGWVPRKGLPDIFCLFAFSLRHKSVKFCNRLLIYESQWVAIFCIDIF